MRSLILSMVLLAAPALAQDNTSRNVILDVHWPSAAESHGRNSVQSLTHENVAPSQAGELAARFDAVRLPVLLPSIEGSDTRLDAKTDELSYVVSYDIPKGHIEVLGTRKAITAPSAGPQLAAEAASASPLHDEVGVSMPLSRYGVSYSVSVYCDQPDADARCSGDDYVRKLASQMSLVGGQPEPANAR